MSRRGAHWHGIHFVPYQFREQARRAEGIPLKQNLNGLFTGYEQGLTIASEPIDLADVLFSNEIEAV